MTAVFFNVEIMNLKKYWNYLKSQKEKSEDFQITFSSEYNSFL